jgi:ferredoxin, 2Fe-2S
VPSVTYRLPDGSERRVEVAVGSSVMRGAVEHNIPGIEAECGGCCVCATCHVYVDPAFFALLPPPEEGEREMLALTASPPHATSRLSCQIAMTAALDGLVVEIPERQS